MKEEPSKHIIDLIGAVTMSEPYQAPDSPHPVDIESGRRGTTRSVVWAIGQCKSVKRKPTTATISHMLGVDSDLVAAWLDFAAYERAIRRMEDGDRTEVWAIGGLGTCEYLATGCLGDGIWVLKDGRKACTEHLKAAVRKKRRALTICLGENFTADQ